MCESPNSIRVRISQYVTGSATAADNGVNNCKTSSNWVTLFMKRHDLSLTRVKNLTVLFDWVIINEVVESTLHVIVLCNLLSGILYLENFVLLKPNRKERGHVQSTR